MSVFHVTTKDRTYNHVTCQWQFENVVRETWADHSPIEAVSIWINGVGWTRLDPVAWAAGETELSKESVE